MFIQDEQEWNKIISDLDEHNALYKLSHLYKIRNNSNEQDVENQSIVPDYIIATPSY